MRDGRAKGTAFLQGIAGLQNMSMQTGERNQIPLFRLHQRDKAKSNHRVRKKGVEGQSNDQREGQFYALICPECHTAIWLF